ncbi:MAG: hypothetical protein ACYDDF_12920 [Thermoplasmatota archaeon]
MRDRQSALANAALGRPARHSIQCHGGPSTAIRAAARTLCKRDGEASTQAIAKAAGVGETSARKYLKEFEKSGEFRAYHDPQGTRWALVKK